MAKVQLTEEERQLEKLYDDLEIQCKKKKLRQKHIAAELEIEQGYVLGLYPHGYSLGEIDSNYRNYYTMPYIHKENATKHP